MPERDREGASGPGGAEPASQRGRSAPDAQPPPARARRRWLGRLVVTPTFFAGACIVLVAVLAYGTTQTHLLYRGLGPICAATSCSASGQGTAGIPDRASARPEKSAAGPPRRPAASRGAGTGPGRRPPRQQASPRTAARPGARAGSRPAAGDAPSRTYSHRLPVVIAYRTVRAWPGGFPATMTITNRSRSAIPNWQLWMHYRRARMDHSGEPGGSGERARTRGRRGGSAPGPVKLRPGASIRFTFRASGRPGPPAGCVFDGDRCSFRPAVAGDNRRRRAEIGQNASYGVAAAYPGRDCCRPEPMSGRIRYRAAGHRELPANAPAGP